MCFVFKQINSKIEFLNNCNINLNKMEYTNSLTDYLFNQGILDEKSKNEFTSAYYSQGDNQDPNESQVFENTAVFTLAWFLKNLSSEQAFSVSERIFNKWQEIEENTFYKKIGNLISIFQRNQLFLQNLQWING